MKCIKKNVIPAVLFLFVLFNFSLVEAKKSKQKHKIAIAKGDHALQILKKYKIDPSEVSIEIRNEDDIIDSVNAKQMKIPASVTKLLTTYAVLQRFPVGFKFKTQLFYDGENLYLKGGGDPAFVSEKMWYLVNEFSRSQISKIKKDIIVDDTLFDDIRFDQSRENKRVDRAYDSPIGAMSFNWNAVNVFIRPSEVDKKALVVIDPESEVFELVNSTKTVAGAAKKDLVVAINNSAKKITVSGEISKNSDEKAIFKSVTDPDLWSGYQLKSFLKQRNIVVTGQVRRGLLPTNGSAKLVASVDSKSISEILTDMNKFSNNFVAEMFTKNLAALDNKQNASLKQGIDIIRSELVKLNLNEKDFHIINPSGFTLENRLSAAALNEVLNAMRNNFPVYPSVLESLPIAGVDGTLKKRMKNSAAEGWVRAKTGYLDGVVSLAGYAGKKNGDVYTFSFLYNGPRDEANVREAFDQIVISLLQ